MGAIEETGTERHGRCLCGAVSIVAKQADSKVTACHCRMCRRWGGGPFMEIACGTDVTINGEQAVAVYDSSVWAERGFCKQCGTHLFYRLKGDGSLQMSVGLFDDDDGLSFEHQVFIDQAPAYYGFSNETKNLTRAELFEKYGAPNS